MAETKGDPTPNTQQDGSQELDTQPQTPLQILRGAALGWKELQDTGTRALWTDKENGPGIFRRNLLQSTELIAGLQGRLMEAADRGETVPDDMLSVVSQLSYMAREALDQDNTFYMGVLLIEQGSLKGDKNYLEKLADSLEPKNPSDSDPV